MRSRVHDPGRARDWDGVRTHGPEAVNVTPEVDDGRDEREDPHERLTEWVTSSTQETVSEAGDWNEATPARVRV